MTKSEEPGDIALDNINESNPDDHSDKAYVNVRVISATVLSAVSAVVCLIAVFVIWIWKEKLPEEGEKIPADWVNCNADLLPPANGLPSILRCLELYTAANVIWRYATGIPIAPRLLNSVCYRNILRAVEDQSLLYRISCDLCIPLLLIEAVSVALLSIITIRLDNGDVQKIILFVFIASAILHMAILSALQFVSLSKSGSQISFAIKVIASVMFTICSPVVAFNHVKFIEKYACHSLVPPVYAIAEYLMLLSNAAFHLTALLDLCHLRFIVYPKTTSGEVRPYQDGGITSVAESKIVTVADTSV
uniref:CWH43-like N-terminal domain-containing protein n=1 Tax=Plectus sambesii TaxID=2011161 RepID=A0A914UUS0_9BILA